MIHRARQILRLAFGKAPDPSTAGGRSRMRYRQAARTTLAGVFAKAMAVIALLGTVSLAVEYLGKDRFGMWMALAGLVSFLGFISMGTGIALKNALAKCHAHGDKETPRRLISGAVFVRGLMAMAMVAFALFILPHLRVETWIKTDEAISRNEILTTFQALIVAFAFGFVVRLLRPIYGGHQREYVAMMWTGVGYVFALGAVLVAIRFRLGLPALVIGYAGVPWLVLAMGGACHLVLRDRWLIPRPQAVGWGAIRSLLSVGFVGLMATVASTLLMGGCPFIIGNRLGAAAVTPFATSNRLMGLGLQALTMLLIALWPAYGEAAARGDTDWVKRTYRRSIVLALGVQMPVFLVMTVAGRAIIGVWAGPAAVPGWSLLMAVNVLALVLVLNRSVSIALNGLNHMVGQATFGMALSLAALGVAYGVAPKYGAVGVVWSLTLVGLVPKCIGLNIELAWVMNRLKGPSPPAAEEPHGGRPPLPQLNEGATL